MAAHSTFCTVPTTTVPKSRNGDRASRLHVNTLEWRDRAIAAFEARGRGAKRQCAIELGFDPALLTKILGGRQASSVEIGPISRWLGIAPPVAIAATETTASIVEVANQMTPEGRAMLLDVALAMLGKKP